MKKIILGVLTVFLVLLGIPNKTVDAQAKAPLKNLLAINNFLIYEYDFGGAYSNYNLSNIEDIKLEPNQYYTLVVSKNFYATQAWEDDQNYFPEVNLYLYNKGQYQNGNLVTEMYEKEEDYLYVTFLATHQYLEFQEFPIDKYDLNDKGPNYRSTDVFLYKGYIEDFLSFNSYKSVTAVEKGVLVLDYDKPKTTEEILKYFNFSDDFDKLTDDSIEIIYNELSQSTNKTGTFKLLFSVADKRNNKRFYELSVVIVDITPPEISGPNEHEVRGDYENQDIGEWIHLLNVSDNHTQLHPGDIVVIDDPYTENKNKAGVYVIVLEVADESNNKTTFEMTITVTDTVPPKVSGPNEIYRYAKDPKLTTADIRNWYQSYDEVDGDLSSSVTLVGTYDPNVPGNYKLHVESKDLSGNIGKKEIMVHVIDSTPPSISANQLIMSHTTFNAMNKDDIIDWLSAQIENGESFLIVFDETSFINDRKEPSYIYYSYEVEGIPYYGRIMIEPETATNTKRYLVITGFLSIGIIFTTFHILSKKKLYTFI